MRRRTRFDRMVRMNKLFFLLVLLTCGICGAAESLRDNALEILPLGRVRPEGALRTRLERQAAGLTGHAEELYRDIGQSDWLTNAGGGADFPKWEIRPKSPWNYALVVKDGTLPGARVADDGRTIRVLAVRTEAAGWGYLRADAPGRAIDPPHSPVDRAVCTAEETVTLVPLSDSQLRIALLPWVE